MDLEKVGGSKKSESLSSQQGVISSPGTVSEDKLQSLSSLAPVNINFPLNLSTEESGYESDLTRKTSSKVKSKDPLNCPNKYFLQKTTVLAEKVFHLAAGEA